MVVLIRFSLVRIMVIPRTTEEVNFTGFFRARIVSFLLLLMMVLLTILNIILLMMGDVVLLLFDVHNYFNDVGS